MSSLPPSPILGLHRFDTDDAMLNTEVNENTDDIDLLPPTVCTSGTRPVSNLFTGRLIWETDTLALVMWTGAAWRYLTNETAVLTSGIVTIAAGWSLQTEKLIVKNGIANLQLEVTRTGATIAAAADGNIVNSAIATVTNATDRPLINVPGSSIDSGINVGAYINTAGTVGINSAPPNVAIPATTQLNIGFSFIPAGY